MKKILISQHQKIWIVCLLLIIEVHLKAQNSVVPLGGVAEETSEYGPTWVWVTGAVVSILLIISLIRWNTNKKSGNQ